MRAPLIYIPEGLSEHYADLIALHEHVEIQHKLAGKSHAYAHRRAYVEELLAAKVILQEPSEFQRYLRSRIRGYPKWKVPNPEEVVARLASVLKEGRPRKGQLLQVIKEHRL